MRRLTTFISGFLFIIWCLPLGAFIKPEKEKEACNGRRAVCLCTHLIKKQQKQQTVKVFLKSGHQAEKESSVSSSHHLDLAARNTPESFGKERFSAEAFALYSRLIIRSIDHVPKADAA